MFQNAILRWDEGIPFAGVTRRNLAVSSTTMWPNPRKSIAARWSMAIGIVEIISPCQSCDFDVDLDGNWTDMSRISIRALSETSKNFVPHRFVQGLPCFLTSLSEKAMYRTTREGRLQGTRYNSARELYATLGMVHSFNNVKVKKQEARGGFKIPLLYLYAVVFGPSVRRSVLFPAVQFDTTRVDPNRYWALVLQYHETRRR